MPTLAELLATPGTPANRVRTTLADMLRGYNREAVAGLVGAPVDMANTVSNLARAGIGYTGHKLGLLPTSNLPDLVEKPVGGSDWIYERLPRQPELTGSGAENVGRIAGAVFSPPVLMQAAPKAAKTLASLLQEKVPAMADNYMDAMGMAPKVVVTGYHGSPNKFDPDQFDPGKAMTGNIQSQHFGIPMFFAAKHKSVAQTYGPNVMRLKMNLPNPLVVDARGEDFTHGLSLLDEQLPIYRNSASKAFSDFKESLINKYGDDAWSRWQMLNEKIMSPDEYSNLERLRAIADADKSRSPIVGKFDSAIVKNVIDQAGGYAQPTDVYIAFDPKQIRPARRR